MGCGMKGDMITVKEPGEPLSYTPKAEDADRETEEESCRYGWRGAASAKLSLSDH